MVDCRWTDASNNNVPNLLDAANIISTFKDFTGSVDMTHMTYR